ncbi:hypothetical protein [uncultured Dialister sp.]|uniref:hypothetical protein n=1 Tax=uncultured Dialister sp. TaxID=278064 RepID=UPI0026342136|nr:hypothetical protein [uncultured Dialister sp.]
MNKIALSLLLGTASALLFSASFLSADAAAYMDWARDSGPAVRQEIKSFKAGLPFQSLKADKESRHTKKEKMKKDGKHEKYNRESTRQDRDMSRRSSESKEALINS